MAGPPYNNFQERVERAAEATLKRNGSVGPLELFQEMRLQRPARLEANKPKSKKPRRTMKK
jgi:hypothetical protein